MLQIIKDKILKKIFLKRQNISYNTKYIFKKDLKNEIGFKKNKVFKKSND